jgi:hypothetical protein
MSSLSNTNACEYAQLGGYNNNKCGTISTPDTKLTVIPSYGSPGYPNVFGQNPSTCDTAGSYQNIEQAYGSLYDNKQYINRLCRQPIPPPLHSQCKGTQYGCCPDGRKASNATGSNCPHPHPHPHPSPSPGIQPCGKCGGQCNICEFKIHPSLENICAEATEFDHINGQCKNNNQCWETTGIEPHDRNAQKSCNKYPR